MYTNPPQGLPGVSGRTVAASLDPFERLLRETEMAPVPEPAPPRWWQRVLPILVALNAFALGVQYAGIARTRAVLDAARAVQTQVDANLARSRELLNGASSACHSYWPEQDDAGQVSRL